MGTKVFINGGKIEMEENGTMQQETKFCKECGQKIAKKAVICPLCGCQVEETHGGNNPQIVITNSNLNQNRNVNAGIQPIGKAIDKWISFFL